jgi:alpha-beta hydrolase superfamily lysophospholipase
MTTIQHEEKTVDAADGTTLYTQSWLPSSGSNKTKAHLVICHGYLEHCGRYKEVAEYLAGQCIAVTVFDFRGHGKSAGTQGYVANFTQYHDDLFAVVASVQQQQSDDKNVVPLFLLGHSNGGLVVLDYMLADNAAAAGPAASSSAAPNNFFSKSVKGVIITSPFLAPANELSYFKVMISRVLGYWLPTLALPANEVTAEILMHDEQKRFEHQNDPLNQSKFTLGWAVQGMRAQKRVQHELKECPVPLLFVYAEDDKVACPTVNKTFANTIGQADKTVVERIGEYHEILNETKRVETYDLIKDWILARSS